MDSAQAMDKIWYCLLHGRNHRTLTHSWHYQAMKFIQHNVRPWTPGWRQVGYRGIQFTVLSAQTWHCMYCPLGAAKVRLRRWLWPHHAKPQIMSLRRMIESPRLQRPSRPNEDLWLHQTLQNVIILSKSISHVTGINVALLKVCCVTHMRDDVYCSS